MVNAASKCDFARLRRGLSRPRRLDSAAAILEDTLAVRLRSRPDTFGSIEAICRLGSLGLRQNTSNACSNNSVVLLSRNQHRGQRGAKVVLSCETDRFRPRRARRSFAPDRLADRRLAAGERNARCSRRTARSCGFGRRVRLGHETTGHVRCERAHVVLILEQHAGGVGDGLRVERRCGRAP